MKLKLLTILIICLSSICGYSQANISFQLIGLGVDFGKKENVDLYQTKVANGNILLEPGLKIGLEAYASDITSLKFVQTARLDACNKLAGSTQILLRFRLFKVWKHSLNIGIGPQAFYRQSWSDIENYQNEKTYKGLDFQYKIMWISGEIEYNYVMNKKWDFSFSLLHQNPTTLGIGLGAKYWFTRKSNRCNTCPSFH